MLANHLAARAKCRYVRHVRVNDYLCLAHFELGKRRVICQAKGQKRANEHDQGLAKLYHLKFIILLVSRLQFLHFVLLETNKINDHLYETNEPIDYCHSTLSAHHACGDGDAHHNAIWCLYLAIPK